MDEELVTLLSLARQMLSEYETECFAKAGLRLALENGLPDKAAHFEAQIGAIARIEQALAEH